MLDPVTPVVLSVERARAVLLGGTDLAAPPPRAGLDGALAVLERLGCVQLDPIDRFGSNADLVLHARVDGLRRADWGRLGRDRAFEHVFKERCLLPASLFPAVREHMPESPWWRTTERLRRLDEVLLTDVLAEVGERGPVAATELSDRGRVDPLDWNGWQGTGRAAHMALEVLWTRCRVVSSGRNRAGKRLYDLPSRALPTWHDRPAPDPARALLEARVRAAALLPARAGPWWTALEDQRDGPALAGLVQEGRVVPVTIEGSRRRWYSTPEHLDREPAEPDDRLRMIGPLDPLVWDRDLVRDVFGLDYVWEVYKPQSARKYGYYVVPLLHRGHTVGLFEGERRGLGRVEVTTCWGAPPEEPFRLALERLGALQRDPEGTTVET